MTNPFKSFLSELANDSGIRASLEQETAVAYEKLFDWVKEARKLYLYLKLTGQELSSAELDEVQENLKNIVLYLENIFIDEMVDNERVLDSEYDSHFALIGMIFEYLGDFEPTSDTKLESYNWYIHSSICYSLGNSPANSTVLAGKVSEDSDDDQILTEFDPEKYLETAQKCVLLFLTRSVRKAQKQAAELAVWKRKGFFDNDLNPVFVETVRGYFELTEFVEYASTYMLTGEKEHIERATERLEAAIKIFVKGFCSFETLLADRLRFIFKQMIARSIWVKLDNLNKKRPGYLKALISQRNPIAELWPSQIAALEQHSDGHNFGILGDEQKHFVISMPTSAGKTRVAEIAIVDAIDQRGHSTCIYVVPTRALVNQVANDLSVLLEDVGYRVGTAAGSYENIPGLENVLIEDVHILVTTPEKLDMLDRSNNDTVRNCKLYIFDECHKLEDAGRGLRLEILISRLKQKNQGLHGARFVLLSAVLPHTNLGEFVAWLGSKKAIDFVWRPTRLLEGVVYKELGGEMPPTHKGRPRKEQFYGVEYPTLFKFDRLVNGTYFPKTSKKKAEESRNRWDIAAELALKYSKLGSVLIFCPTKAEAQNVALRFIKHSRYKKNIPQNDREEILSRRNALAELIEDRLVKDFPLANAVKLGVAYHHASLPSDIKKEIELSIKRGDINIVAATTTLAEGLNTPVKTVIFADVIYATFDEVNPTKQKLIFQVDPKQFRNIAGRAGRALHDTEGHTILLDFHTIYELFSETKYSLEEFDVVSSFRKVLDKKYADVLQSGESETTLRSFYLGADAADNSPVRSRFFDLLGAIPKQDLDSTTEQDDDETMGLLLSESTKSVADEERFFQSGILALVCEEENLNPNTSLDEATLSTISKNGIENTLFAYQLKDQPDLLKDSIQYTKRQAKFVSSHVDRITRQVYNRTGLSLGSCVSLDKFIQGFIEQEKTKSEQTLLADWRGNDGQLLLGKIRKFLECVNIPVETKPKELRKIEIKTSFEDVLYDWITGKSIADIVARNFQAKSQHEQARTKKKRIKSDDSSDVMLEAVNYIYSHIVTFSSWALGAACTLLRHHADKLNVQVNPEVWLLPAYTLYGVDSPIACFCIAMGIDDRNVALTVAKKYPVDQISQTYTNVPSWESVKWWFGNISHLSLESWLNTKRKVDIAWEAIQQAKKKFNLPKTDNYQNYLFSCDLRGLAYEGRMRLLKDVYVGYVLRLVREENEFDKNAIRAELEDARLLGYIPRELAPTYATMIDEGITLYAQVVTLTDASVSVYVFKAS